VSAPPELRTITPDPSVVTVSDGDSVVPFALVPDSSVVVPEEVEVGLDPDDVGVNDGSDEDDTEVDSDVDELVESDVETSSAHATPGVVVTAPLTPSATASAPTRPMYLAYALVIADPDPRAFC
jgi:hypothetical protein